LASTTARLGNDAVAHCRKLGLFYARFLSCVLGVRANRLAVALPTVPPFNEVASFGVVLILSVDENMIFSHPPFAVEKDDGKGPLVIDFDVLTASTPVMAVQPLENVRTNTTHRCNPQQEAEDVITVSLKGFLFGKRPATPN
jgi:hypothetical protein